MLGLKEYDMEGSIFFFLGMEIFWINLENFNIVLLY